MSKPVDHKKMRNHGFLYGIFWLLIGIGNYFTNQPNRWLWKCNIICFVLYLWNAYKEHKKIDKNKE